MQLGQLGEQFVMNNILHEGLFDELTVYYRYPEDR